MDQSAIKQTIVDECLASIASQVRDLNALVTSAYYTPHTQESIPLRLKTIKVFLRAIQVMESTTDMQMVNEAMEAIRRANRKGEVPESGLTERS